MVLVKIMKRKDASSVLMAVVIGLILYQFATGITGDIAARIAGIGGANDVYVGGPGWQIVYLQPIVALVLQIIVLEIIVRIYVLVHDSLTKKK